MRAQAWDFLAMNVMVTVDTTKLLTIAHADADFRIRLREGETPANFIAAIGKREAL